MTIFVECSQHHISRDTIKITFFSSEWFDVFCFFPFKTASWMFCRYIYAKNVFSAAVQRSCPKLGEKQWVAIFFMPCIHGQGIFLQTEYNQEHVQKYPLELFKFAGPTTTTKVCFVGSDDSFKCKREVWLLMPLSIQGSFQWKKPDLQPTTNLIKAAQTETCTVCSEHAFVLLRFHKTKYIIIKTIVQVEIIPVIRCQNTI